MSIIVSGIHLPFDRPAEEAVAIGLRQCGLCETEVSASVYRKSVDARHGKINIVYSIRVDGIANEQAFADKLQMPAVRFRSDDVILPQMGNILLTHRPVVVGMGPAGIFAAYILACNGYRPIVLERGYEIDARDQAVQDFFASGVFCPSSNIQFGEGGAGAYSDGKLTTRINDPLCETVLQTLVQHGAPREVLLLAKPHIGTDVLKGVVRSMRKAILEHGGEVHFCTTLTGLQQSDGTLCAIEADEQAIACERAVLAIGHSARDTFEALQKNLFMEPKAFSVGARIEHAQSEIDQMLYGSQAGHPLLPPAEYALSYRANGRACYSFCMCPGGFVVAAQSEENSIVTNGMSYHARNGSNANAAIVVSVEPSDFNDGDALGGIAFQRRIERSAYLLSGSYRAPCQRVGDFLAERPSSGAGSVQPTYPHGVVYGNIHACLPDFVGQHMKEGLRAFEKRMHGFAMSDALLTAPETRTSSPVRMTRGKDLFSVSVKGVIPCGEGAGYAGGIMSAAVDGIRAAQCIMREFAPF